MFLCSAWIVTMLANRPPVVSFVDTVWKSNSAVFSCGSVVCSWALTTQGLFHHFYNVSNGNNAYAVCMPDGQVHCHRKLHAWEHRLISSGNTLTVFDTPWGIRAGILICWDNNLIENAREAHFSEA
jgi:predicted amidohydrolase